MLNPPLHDQPLLPPLQDLADVVVRLVELANSHEATTMAAEFTVNVAHALEMEHMAGINRRAAAKSSAADAAGDGGSAGHHPSPGPSAGAGDAAFPAGNPDGGGGSESAAGGAAGKKQEERTLDDLVHEARIERARQEGVGGGGGGGGGGGSSGGSSVEGPGSTGHTRNESAGSSVRVLDGGEEKDDLGGEVRNGEGRGERASLDRDPQRVSTMPIIRQADLKGDTPLSTLRRAGTAAAAVSPTTPRSDRAAASAFRSPPSSPRGRHNSLPAASAATADAALAALEGSLSPEAAPRGRASSLTGTGLDAGGGGGGGGGGGEGVGVNRTAAAASSSDAGADAEARERPGAGVGRRGVGAAAVAGFDSDDTESVVSGTRPAVEYVRDGKAKLPRFKSAHIASVLRGQPLGLELQLEAPNEDSLDDTVARASRLPLGGIASPCSSRVGLAGGSSFGGTQQAIHEATGALPGGEAAGDPGNSAAAERARGGWKQLLFALFLLLFAADGLRHRWKSTFRSESAAAAAATAAAVARKNSSSRAHAQSSTAPRQEPFERYRAGGDEDGGGGEGGKHTFGTAFLPPTCQDPVSGRTMAVWATPAGPCLAPASASGGENWGARGGRGGREGGPGCAASFRLCTSAEVVVQDSGGVGEYGGGPERDEL